MKKILLSLVALFMGIGMAVAQSEVIYSLEPVEGKNNNAALSFWRKVIDKSGPSFDKQDSNGR